MKKIPLESTLGGAYRFLFTRIISIVGNHLVPDVAVRRPGRGSCVSRRAARLAGGWQAIDLEHFKPEQLTWEKLRPFFTVCARDCRLCADPGVDDHGRPDAPRAGAEEERRPSSFSRWAHRCGGCWRVPVGRRDRRLRPLSSLVVQLIIRFAMSMAPPPAAGSVCDRAEHSGGPFPALCVGPAVLLPAGRRGGGKPHRTRPLLGTRRRQCLADILRLAADRRAGRRSSPASFWR